LRRESALEQRLQAVVTRRIHRDHLLALRLERDPEVVEDEDTTNLGGEGLVVEADLADVGRPRDRPEPGLLGVVGQRAPMDGRLAAQASEYLVGRTVLPEVEVAEVEPAEVLFGD